MIEIQNAITAIFLVAGAFFVTAGSIGIVRLPNFYNRVHSGSMSDTLGIILFTVGMVVHNGLDINSVKLVAVFILVSLTNPVASHAIVRAAFDSGVKPWFRKDDKEPN